MSYYPGQNYYGANQRNQQPPYHPQQQNYRNGPPPNPTYRETPPYYPQQQGYRNQYPARQHQEPYYAPPPGHPPGPQYAPPPGPPPGQHYAPPPGPPPSQSYAPPPGPPPSHSYAPPPGPPPGRDYAPPPFPPPSQNNNHGPRPVSAHTPFQAPPPNLDAYGFPLKQFNDINRSTRPGPPPPTAPQQFGNGAPEGYRFQYSNCTGRRKALLIGINYFGQKGELKGCINDVHNVSAFLVERYGYKREDMVILTDDQSNPIMHPTKANMIAAFEWLVKDARPNDSLFLHYSGHGGRTEDLDGDEDDGFDDVIYPVDWRQAGHIVDDEIHWRVVRPLQAGVRLTTIFDSCHSATAMDLPYVYSTKGVLKEPNLAKEAGQGLLGAYAAYLKDDVAGMATSILNFTKSALNGNEGYQKTIETRTSPADVVMWAGSKDDQTSADATIDSKATGAMSWAFITALTAKPQQSYVELLNNIRNLLEPNYTQKPQLSCSHPLDTDLLFVM
ncbi:caspase domain-containing protein [Dactylonectria macrodidyma]|uniref:Caspase domain-containing protein n=1 Tax=Dactylonectria macrodidyma TaxID=307937 RepID=A0A9P9JHN5_9HYPO|nr:caspase domain-containing protein [Dactylonectria macrodidyma]